MSSSNFSIESATGRDSKFALPSHSSRTNRHRRGAHRHGRGAGGAWSSGGRRPAPSSRRMMQELLTGKTRLVTTRKRPCLNNPAPNAGRRTASSPCSRTRARPDCLGYRLPRRMARAREQPPHRDGLLRDESEARGYSDAQISAALQKLETAADPPASRSIRPTCAPTNCCATACRCRSPPASRTRRCIWWIGSTRRGTTSPSPRK